MKVLCRCLVLGLVAVAAGAQTDPARPGMITSFTVALSYTYRSPTDWYLAERLVDRESRSETDIRGFVPRRSSLRPCGHREGVLVDGGPGLR